MTPFALRCRVCEEVTAPEALDACRRCDGPTDVTYDWDRVARVVTPDGIAAGLRS
jgi:RNA polymerase subunit RPABC4/transcription elongation factor Spt4